LRSGRSGRLNSPRAAGTSIRLRSSANTSAAIRSVIAKLSGRDLNFRNSNREHVVRITVASFLCILVSVAATTLKADSTPWGYDGHRIVCSIAWRNMTPATQIAVQELLNQDSLRFQQFEEACLWADEVRGDNPEYDRFTTAHYVNLPRRSDGVDPESHCALSLCIVQAISEQREILADSKRSTRERLDALKWVAHFVGDVHQPMHVGYGDDRGGNRIAIILAGQPTNLHSLWDYGLIAHSGLEWNVYARRLGYDISPVDRRQWASPNPIEWADESYSITEDTVYEFPLGSEVKDEYYYRNIQTVERQLKKAGIRLANLLNGVFDV